MDKKDLNDKPYGKEDWGLMDEKHISPLVAAAIAVALNAHFSNESSLCSDDFAVAS